MGDDEDTVVPVVPADTDTDTDTEDRTIVVERDDPEDHTVVIERDNTVVIDRRRGRGTSTPAPDPVLTVLPARRGIRTAPIEPARRSVEPASTVEAYAPRPVAPAPKPGPAVPRGAGPERAANPVLPSVARRSRKSGALALLLFAGACVVSVIGIVAVIVWFVRG